MLIGSEGILGVIAEAWVRVRPRPEFKASAGVEFDDFLAAAEAVREIAQSGLYPANCRLLDALEAGLTGAGDGERNLLSSASSPPTTPWTPRWTGRWRSPATTVAPPATPAPRGRRAENVDIRTFSARRRRFEDAVGLAGGVPAGALPA